MANSRYEYVRAFEQPERLLPQCWVVVRVDGRAFTKFSADHAFEKPNDAAALRLMNACALECCSQFPDIVVAYGASDEYSFVFRKTTQLYERRPSKLISVLASLFAASYVLKWPEFFPDRAIQYAPSFDGRAVCYPSNAIMQDYLAWRQADCHINNQYNTCFWNLVQREGLSHAEAQAVLKGTVSSQKNELMFSRFGINYSNLPELFRKGSVVYRKKTLAQAVSSTSEEGNSEASSQPPRVRNKQKLVVEHIDIIKNQFWSENPHIMGLDRTELFIAK